MKQQQLKLEPTSINLYRFKNLLPILVLAYIPTVVVLIIIKLQNVNLTLIV